MSSECLSVSFCVLVRSSGACLNSRSNRVTRWRYMLPLYLARSPYACQSYAVFLLFYCTFLVSFVHLCWDNCVMYSVVVQVINLCKCEDCRRITLSFTFYTPHLAWLQGSSVHLLGSRKATVSTSSPRAQTWEKNHIRRILHWDSWNTILYHVPLKCLQKWRDGREPCRSVKSLGSYRWASQPFVRWPAPDSRAQWW